MKRTLRSATIFLAVVLLAQTTAAVQINVSSSGDWNMYDPHPFDGTGVTLVSSISNLEVGHFNITGNRREYRAFLSFNITDVNTSCVYGVGNATLFVYHYSAGTTPSDTWIDRITCAAGSCTTAEWEGNTQHNNVGYYDTSTATSANDMWWSISITDDVELDASNGVWSSWRFRYNDTDLAAYTADNLRNTVIYEDGVGPQIPYIDYECATTTTTLADTTTTTATTTTSTSSSTSSTETTVTTLVTTTTTLGSSYVQPVIVKSLLPFSSVNLSLCSTNTECGDTFTYVYPATSVGATEEVIYMEGYGAYYNILYYLSAYNQTGGSIVTKAPVHVYSDRFKSDAPASSTEACDTGFITWDADYVYVCVEEDTWKRSALSSW